MGLVLSLFLVGCHRGTSQDTIDPSPNVHVEHEATLVASTEMDNLLNATEEATADVDAAARSVRAFAAALLGRMDTDRSENVIFSPYNVHLTLMMALAGASESTLDEMERTLHVQDRGELAHADAAALLAQVAAQPREGQDPQYVVAVSNRLFADRSAQSAIVPSFLTLVRDHYKGDLETLDFARDLRGSIEHINQRVSDDTRERIPELLDPDAIDPDVVMIIVGALYFRGTWSTEFAASRTEDRPFTLASGEEVQVPTMMRRMTSTPLHIGDDFVAVALDYQQAPFQLVVVLPNEGALESVHSRMTDGTILENIHETRRQQAVVQMPRFSMRVSTGLGDLLKALGMPRAFTDDAEFGRMFSERLEVKISEVIHEAFIDVDEEGTEAAAATAIVMMPTSAALDPPQPIHINIDRPFYFVLRHVPTNTPLFLGRVSDPR